MVKFYQAIARVSCPINVSELVSKAVINEDFITAKRID